MPPPDSAVLEQPAAITDAEEIQWLECGQDPNGRLFVRDGRLFRAMKTRDAGFYTGLLETIEETPVLRGGMIPTTVCDMSLAGATAVLEHERIEPMTLPFAWSPGMFRDAALLHCDVHLELARAGYNLQDAHLWNVGFKNTTPQFLDFGSVIDRDSTKLRRALLGEYRSYMVHPLLLMSRGHYPRARRYLHESNPPLTPRDLLGYFGALDGAAYLRHATRQSLRCRRDVVRMVASVRDQIAGLSAPREKSRWAGYHDDEAARAPADWHDKQRHAADIISRLRPGTLLDFGCATGWYSAQAAEAGCRVVAMDVEHGMVDEVYALAAARRLSITPVVGDLFAGVNPLGDWQADLVLALAVVHHLALTQAYTLDQIVATLARHTRRWLLTEFIDRNDAFVQQQRPDLLADYDLARFERALRRTFSTVERFASSSENRTLLLCTR